MPDWFLESGVYLLGLVVVVLVGPLLICWGLWCDRSKGRPRCPKCWYDMRGSLPRLECPECGHKAQRRRGLYRNRRGRWRINVGIVSALLSAYPLTVIGGWMGTRSTMWWYGITSSVTHKRIGPAWLVDSLPHAIARFFERVHSLNIDDPTQLAAIPRLRHLRALSLHGEQITDADLVHLKGLSNLESFVLRDTRVTDAGFIHLKRLSNLYILDLDRV